ncbi:uncharacterized protein LOC135840975 [Planococcus citri]|uniref:uncharacterized protein LOC135840975 n=1 Tax=Planococcus citri TaxID=170843 RepID=UPI0031F88052
MTRNMINTFVFLDLESTGLPMYGNRVRVTELCFVAVSRKSILECSKNEDCIPRILKKLSFVVNPRAPIPDEVVQLTGLSNENLEDESPFDQNKADMIKLFFQSCVPPMCMIAHNGIRFDFPLLKKELAAFNQAIPADLLCADSMPGFKRVNIEQNDTTLSPIIDQTDVMLFDAVSRIEQCISQEANETTPMAQLITTPGCSNGKMATPTPPSPQLAAKIVPANFGNVKRKLFVDGDRGEQSNKLKLNYSLNHVYLSLFSRSIANAHRAESDTIALLQCCVKMGSPLLEYFDSEAKKFEDVIAMR